VEEKSLPVFFAFGIPHVGDGFIGGKLHESLEFFLTTEIFFGHTFFNDLRGFDENLVGEGATHVIGEVWSAVEKAIDRVVSYFREVKPFIDVDIAGEGFARHQNNLSKLSHIRQYRRFRYLKVITESDRDILGSTDVKEKGFIHQRGNVDLLRPIREIVHENLHRNIFVDSIRLFVEFEFYLEVFGKKRRKTKPQEKERETLHR